MLQTINVQALSQALGNQPQVSGFARPESTEVPAFELQSLSVDELSERVVNALAQSRPQAGADQDGEVAEVDVDQWLQGMLDQQNVRVEAREGVTEPAPESEQQEQEQTAQPAAQEALQVVSQMLPATLVTAAVPLVKANPLVERSIETMPVSQAPQVIVTDSPELPAAAPQHAEQNLPMPLPDTASAVDPMAALAGDGESAAPASAAHNPAGSAPAVSERSLRLHGAPAQWGEQMLNNLREHVDLQVNQRIQNATIRLDPPELGSMEIFLSHESGRLSVHLSATNGDVARLLQQTSDRLRQELVGQNFVQVNVQVSADAQGGRQQQRARQQAWLAEESVAAASVISDTSGRNATDSASDVLVTV